MRWLFSFCFSFTEFQLETVSKAFHITVAGLRSLKNTNKKMNKDFLNFFKPDVTGSSFQRTLIRRTKKINKKF